METFAEDSAVIAEFIGLQNFTFNTINASPSQAQNQTKEYFLDLPFELKQSLFEFYKVDFEMFGYSAEEYF